MSSNDKSLYRWVKASERLPEGKRQIFIRSVHTKAGGMIWSDELIKMDGLENIEWLDESHPSSPEGWVSEAREALKKIDAISFHKNEWAEMAEINKIATEALKQPHTPQSVEQDENWWKNGTGKSLAAPSSTEAPVSVEEILDNEHWKFVEEIGLTSIHTKTFPEAYRQQAIRAMQEYGNRLVADKDREIEELKEEIQDFKDDINEAAGELLIDITHTHPHSPMAKVISANSILRQQKAQVEKEVEYWKARCEAAEGVIEAITEPPLGNHFVRMTKWKTLKQQTP